MNERKYCISNNQLVKRVGLKPVPDDEPVFILRAQDRKALAALTAYHAVVDTLEQKASITTSIEDFRVFQYQHPERMKEPDPD